MKDNSENELLLGLAKLLLVGESAMPKYSIKAGKTLSGFGSHLRNIIRDVAKQ